jgi:hypothetical protein
MAERPPTHGSSTSGGPAWHTQASASRTSTARSFRA